MVNYPCGMADQDPLWFDSALEAGGKIKLHSYGCILFPFRGSIAPCGCNPRADITPDFKFSSIPILNQFDRELKNQPQKLTTRFSGLLLQSHFLTTYSSARLLA